MLVTDSYLPVISGVTTVVNKQSVYLRKRGHRISVVCMGDDYRYKTCTTDKVKIYRFPSVSNPFRNDNRISLPSWIKLSKIIKTIKPDVMHIHTPGTLGLLSKLLADRKKTLVVSSIHSTPEFVSSYFDFLPRTIDSNLEEFIWRYYKWFYNDMDVNIVPSFFIKRQARKNGILTKIEILPMWIDASTPFSSSSAIARKKWHVPEGKTIFLYYGRIDKDKNLDMLVDAVHGLVKDKKIGQNIKNNFLLIMAGSGVMIRKLKLSVNEKKLQNYIKIYGYINRHDLPGLFHLSHCFVMPALYEAQSIVTLQAIAYGLKTLIAKSGALEEIGHRFDQHCIFFDPQTSTALKRQMQQIIKYPPQRQVPPDDILKKFYHRDKILDKLEEIYKVRPIRH